MVSADEIRIDVIVDAAQASRAFKKLSDDTEDYGESTDELQKKVGSLQQRLGNLQTAMDTSASTTTRLTAAFTAARAVMNPYSAAVTAAGLAMKLAASRAANLADQMDTLQGQSFRNVFSDAELDRIRQANEDLGAINENARALVMNPINRAAGNVTLGVQPLIEYGSGLLDATRRRGLDPIGTLFGGVSGGAALARVAQLRSERRRLEQPDAAVASQLNIAQGNQIRAYETAIAAGYGPRSLATSAGSSALSTIGQVASGLSNVLPGIGQKIQADIESGLKRDAKHSREEFSRSTSENLNTQLLRLQLERMQIPGRETAQSQAELDNIQLLEQENKLRRDAIRQQQLENQIRERDPLGTITLNP